MEPFYRKIVTWTVVPIFNGVPERSQTLSGGSKNSTWPWYRVHVDMNTGMLSLHYINGGGDRPVTAFPPVDLRNPFLVITQEDNDKVVLYWTQGQREEIVTFYFVQGNTTSRGHMIIAIQCAQRGQPLPQGIPLQA